MAWESVGPANPERPVEVPTTSGMPALPTPPSNWERVSPDPTPPQPMTGPYTAEQAVGQFMGEGTEELPELRTLLREKHNRETADMSPAERQQDWLKRYGGITFSADIGASEADQLDILVQRIPGITFRRGPRGGVIAKLPSGEEAYLNRPGASRQDFSTAATLAIPGVVAGPAAAMSWPMRGLLAAGISLGESGAREATLEGLGSRVSADWEREGATAGLAAGAEIALPPMLKGLGHTLVALGRAGRLVRNRQLTEEARQAFRDAGVDPDTVSPERMETFASQLPDIEEPSQAAAVRQSEAQTLEPPVTLTRGQATQEYAQLQDEDMLRRMDDTMPGRAARADREAQDAALRQNVETLAQRVSGRQEPPSMHAGGREVAEELVRQELSLRGRVGTAYEAAQELAASQGSPTIQQRHAQNLTPSIRDDLDYRGFDLEVLPLTNRYLDELDTLTSPEGGGPINWADLNRWVKRVRQAERSAPYGSSERVALGRMKRAYTDWHRDAAERALYDGDDTVLRAMRDADALAAQHQELFKRDNIVKALTQRNQDGSNTLKVAPEEAANRIFGTNSFGTRSGLVAAIGDLKKMLPPEQWDALRAEALRRLTRDQPADPARFSAPNLRKALDGALRDHKVVMERLFDKEELAHLKRLRNVALWVQDMPMKGGANPSGSAWTMLRALQSPNLTGPLGRFMRSLPLLSDAAGRAQDWMRYSRSGGRRTPGGMPADRDPTAGVLPPVGARPTLGITVPGAQVGNQEGRAPAAAMDLLQSLQTGR